MSRDILFFFKPTYIYCDEMLKRWKSFAINRARSASKKCIMGNLAMQHIYYRTMQNCVRFQCLQLINPGLKVV